MKATSRLVLRTALPVVVVAAVLLSAMGAAVVDHVSLAGAGQGFQSTEIRVENAGAGTQLVMVQDSLSTVVLSSADLTVPVGRPTIFATFDEGGDDLDQLAITTGEVDQIDIDARSTAASLVALSPGVLSGDDAWFGTVGHAVSSPAFGGLVDAVKGSSELTGPRVEEALAATIEPLAMTGTDRCPDACGEWLASTGAIVVENTTASRAVLVPVLNPTSTPCGSVAPATRRPADGALIVGVDATGGGTTEVDVADAPAIVPSLTRVDDVEACGRGVAVITAGAEEPAARLAAWATLLTDYAVPLIDLVGGSRTDLAAEDLARLAATPEATVEPSAATAVQMVVEEVGGLSAAQLATIDAITAAVGDGLLDPARLPGTNRNVIDAPVAAPTTTTTTTTTTAPPPSAPSVGGAVAISYQTGQDPKTFDLTVTVRNTGEATINLASTSYRLMGGAGSPVTPTSVPADLRTGTLASGQSRKAVVRFALPGSAASYRLEWRIQSDLVVGAEL